MQECFRRDLFALCTFVNKEVKLACHIGLNGTGRFRFHVTNFIHFHQSQRFFTRCCPLQHREMGNDGGLNGFREP